MRANEHADAVAWTQRALELNPGDAESYAWLANVLSHVGRSHEALEQLDRAMRLDPLHPPLWDFYIGRALLHIGRYEEALASLETCIRRAPAFYPAQRYRASALAQLKREAEARAAFPDPALPGSYGSIGEIRLCECYAAGVEFDRYIEGLRRAGLPE